MIGLFSIAIFVGAALLFLVQPMVAKMVLPLLGGSPSVWNTCMVFFQALLLAGYAYAHWSVRWLGVRRQVAVHAIVMALPLVLWGFGFPPIGVPGEPPPGQLEPVGWLLKTLALCIGPAFLVVSTCGPLVQRWFAATGHAAAKDPYFLYAASNAGSMLALLAYPLIVEPTLTLAQQRRLWTVGYILFVALSLVCATKVRRVPQAAAEVAEPEAPAPTMGRRIRWVLLAMVPSSFMLAVTQYLSTDIAAIPLLWVVPLAIYLLTFIAAFSAKHVIPKQLIERAFPILAVAIGAVLLLNRHDPIWIIIVLNLLALFFAGLMCHGQLAETRPGASRLTEFYLLIALGGVLGGIFNAIAAPLLFNSLLEYPIMLVAACLLRPGAKLTKGWLGAVVEVAPAAIPILAAWIFGRAARKAGATVDLLLVVEVGVPMVICYMFVKRPVRFGLALGSLLITSAVMESSSQRFQKRTFFGIYTASLVQNGDMMQLVHGTTLHGLQWINPAKRSEPLSYYHRGGPIGLIFKAYGSQPLFDNVGLVGLGTGSLAAYGKPGQNMTIFEIDPAVVHLSRDSGLFTYVKDSRASIRFVLGDARLSLAREPEGKFGLIALDAFSSDAVPVHLLTKEAVRMYMTKLRPGGLLAFHISNRYLELDRVLAGVAADLGLTAMVCEIVVDEKETIETGHRSATWVAVARTAADLQPLRKDPAWKDLKPTPGSIVWTDDYSSVVPVFQW